MTGHVEGEATDPFARGLAELASGRRTLLRAGGAGLAISTAAAAAGPAGAAGHRTSPRHRQRRAYVVVIDGCRPEELDEGLTPRLQALRDGGMRYPRASSMPVMETIPNHVMMMSGVRPDRSGVPANSIFDRAAGAVRTLDRQSDVRGKTVIERLNGRGYRTGTVLSKEYLYGVFGTRATYRWEPAPLLPVTEHAPDRFTMAATLSMIDSVDPHLVFVNLGDIDRFGHADVTGPLGLEASRRTALADTDALIGQLVDHLHATGRWERSALIVLADHSMDWSLPTQVISLTAPLNADPLLAGKVQIACNGGADLVYWTGAEEQRAAAVERIRAIAAAVPGVLSTHPTTDPVLRLGPEAGDVLAYCAQGWRFSDPNPLISNPIPGNHGHPATRRIPFFIGGGHPLVPRGASSPRHAHTVDVAPTLATFFGIRPPKAGYDGRSRL
jgi:type I phosphodiesterase/nucleotide pyrophosphatase